MSKAMSTIWSEKLKYETNPSHKGNYHDNVYTRCSLPASKKYILYKNISKTSFLSLYKIHIKG